MASAIFHAARFRRSTTFETARTCANGTLCTMQAYMNAAPSMLSTCGLNIAGDGGDRSLVCRARCSP